MEKANEINDKKAMNLKEILTISGKPGLYKLIAQSRGGVIVESLADGKRFPVAASQNVSSLGDIAIYTYEDEKPLAEIFKAINEKESGGKCLSHKESEKEIRAYIVGLIPNYDQERVYVSDMKKLLNWYNILHENELLIFDEEVETEDTSDTQETIEADTQQDE